MLQVLGIGLWQSILGFVSGFLVLNVVAMLAALLVGYYYVSWSVALAAGPCVGVIMLLRKRSAFNWSYLAGSIPSMLLLNWGSHLHNSGP
jgi:uncharacterized membrane protein (Fun14 family)